MYVPIGGTFGSISSPSNFEPLASARVWLVKHISRDKTLVKKHWNIIKHLKICERPDTKIEFIQAKLDNTHKGILNDKGVSDSTEFNMLVDDSMFVETRDYIYVALVASIEALYIIFGSPEENFRQNPLSLDKYYQSICSYQRIQLGKKINTRTMMIVITKEKLLKMVIEIKHWHSGKKSFTIMQGVILCGTLEHWVDTLP